VQRAFAHRRKALPKSIAMAGGVPGVPGDELRERVRDIVVTLGHPADVRAERLSPEDFRALWEALR
jgi:16S rRNA (adenine1518-N6/adenine1519-N6)-dimethyltransferase